MLCVKGGFEILKVQIKSASDLAQQEWKKTDVAMTNYEQLKYFRMAPPARRKCVSAENKIVWEWFDFRSFDLGVTSKKLLTDQMFAEPLKGHCCPAQVTRDVCYLIKVLVLASMRWFADWEIMCSLLPIFLCNLHCSITSRGTITPKWRSRQELVSRLTLADGEERVYTVVNFSMFGLTGGLWPEVDVNVATQE